MVQLVHCIFSSSEPYFNAILLSLRLFILTEIAMKTLSDFTNLFPLSKTLRFKLIPIGNTLKNIEASGILDEDRHRAESYVKVNEIIYFNLA